MNQAWGAISMPHIRVGADSTPKEVPLVHADMHECSKHSHTSGATIIAHCTQAACLQFILGATDTKKRKLTLWRDPQQTWQMCT